LKSGTRAARAPGPSRARIDPAQRQRDPELPGQPGHRLGVGVGLGAAETMVDVPEHHRDA
jgi:hypothetical protein